MTLDYNRVIIYVPQEDIMAKIYEIRNRTAEFLIFQIVWKDDGVQVVCRDESIWCTQRAMAQFFDVGVPAISKHLNIFKSEDFVENSVISKMEITTTLGY